ncbi:cubilin-like isoform X3 [Ornithodoros turicata]|uniref:cubilin-like isoform X3 n=1 Tax=Ornithodoros turicata TaxID=34597 RepID=UPI003139977A
MRLCLQRTVVLCLVWIFYGGLAQNDTRQFYQGSDLEDFTSSTNIRHCDATIQTLEDWIFTPNYPSDYDSFRTCTFTVRKVSTDICTLLLTFNDFDVEDSDGCANDYLLLPDGQRLCGALPPDTTKQVSISRRHSKFTFIFSSNEAYTAKGFMIKVTQLTHTCTDDVPDSPLYPPDSESAEFPLATDKHSPIESGHCNRDILGYSHVLTSPGYPYGYSNYERCTYRVWRADSSVCVVELDIQDFTLNPEDYRGCLRDYLELPDNSRLCGVVSGTKLLEFSPGSDTLTMTFVSDAFGSGRGFSIHLRQRRNSCGFGPTGGCDQRLLGSSGIIRSPNYPRFYGPNQRCRYTVVRLNPFVCRVEFTFKRFNLETSYGCRKDYVELPDRSRLCGRYTGTKVFEFNQDAMNLYFVSDSYVANSGFEIEVHQLINSCLERAPTRPSNSVLPYGTCGRLRSAAGRLDSPRYPAFYPPNLDCNYWIHKSSPEVCRAQLYFTRFDLGTYLGGRCPFDFLDIQGTKYCGRRDGQALIVDFPYKRDTIVLRLHTDHTSQKSGFRIQVRQMTTGCARSLQPQSSPRVSCNQVFTTEEFQIVSLGFRRGGYLPNTDCAYVIKKSDFRVCALEIKIDAFDLEDDADCDKDYLQFNEVKLCGKQAYGATRTIEFLDDELKVHFHSNPTINGAGFFVSAKQVSC